MIFAMLPSSVVSYLMSVYSLAVVHCALIWITLIRLPAMGSLKCAAFRVCPEPAGDGAALRPQAFSPLFPVFSGRLPGGRKLAAFVIYGLRFCATLGTV